jgi:hypothetical protein
MTEQTGFKGAWLCERLALIGAKVGEFALPPEPNRYNPFSVSCIESRICSTFGDAWPAGGSATRTVTVAGVKTHFGRV